MRIPTAFLVTACVLLLQACGIPQSNSEQASAEPQEPLVWPAPPATPRIRYVRSIAGPQDLGITRPLFRRLMDAIAGSPAERFVRPTGVAARDGVLYVADPGTPALWVLDAAHARFVEVTTIGGDPLRAPVAVAPGPAGGVFLADTALGKVFLLDADGKLLRVAAQDGLERPAGIAWDAADQSLYVADSAANRISVFGPDGKRMRSWGRSGEQPGEFNHPTHLSLDRAGTLHVTDALGFRIESFDRSGRLLASFGQQGDGSGDFAAPKGVASDSDGNLYVVDALFDAVQIFRPDGTFLLGFGGRGTGAGEFSLPGGLFVDAQDRMYVADAYNQRVQVFLAAPALAREARP